MWSYEWPWLLSSSWMQAENTFHQARQSQQWIPQLLSDKYIMHIPPKRLLLHRGYLKKNSSAYYGSWSSIMITTVLFRQVFVFYMVTYMVSLWRCISYLVTFGTITQSLKIFVTLFLCYLLMQKAPLSHKITVLWQRQDVWLLLALILASSS